MDERFDGIVYSVAFVGGATCAIHLNNLPGVIAGVAISWRSCSWRCARLPRPADSRHIVQGLRTELGQGFVLILAAVFVGAILGRLQCARVATVANGLPFVQWWLSAPPVLTCSPAERGRYGGYWRLLGSRLP